jgi:hypothetical protein
LKKKAKFEKEKRILGRKVGAVCEDPPEEKIYLKKEVILTELNAKNGENERPRSFPIDWRKNQLQR